MLRRMVLWPAAAWARGAALAALIARLAGAQAVAPAVTCARFDSAQVAHFARSADGARALLRADGGRLWGTSLGGIAWLGVARVGDALCAFATDDPNVAGYASIGQGARVWAGTLATGLTPANTSIDWAGHRWAMVILPLPDDSVAAIRLLVHEAVHTIQDTTPTAALWSVRYMEGAAGAALLDRAEGRTSLRLELRALARALLAHGPEQRRAARDALAFRARRIALATADERTRERALDVDEGLPEYTAWKLTAATGAPARVAAMLAARDSSMADSVHESSIVRSFPYATGPAYALLLDALSPTWRERLRAARDSADLQRLLATVVGISPSDPAAERYGIATVERQERARWTRHDRELADLCARFVTGPTIRIRPASMRVAFDPNAQVSLGAAGTVMRGLAWRGKAGEELNAPAGALVSTDWRELRVPAASLTGGTPTAGPLAAPIRWQGAGWKLELPAGWVAARDGASWILTPP